MLAEQHFVAGAQIGVGQHGENRVRSVAARHDAGRIQAIDLADRLAQDAARCLRDRAPDRRGRLASAATALGLGPSGLSLDDSLKTFATPGARWRGRRHRARCRECRAWAWVHGVIAGSEKGGIDSGRARAKAKPDRRQIAPKTSHSLTGGLAHLSYARSENWTVHDRDGKSAIPAAAERARSRCRQAGAFRPRQAADAGLRPHAVALHHRLYDLWHAQRRQEQRRPGLPCADRRPVRRQPTIPSPASPAGGTRMVGPGKPIDTDRFFVICANVHRRLHGLDRPGRDRSRHRQALWPRFSAGHHPRHGARPGDAARCAGHRETALRDRRLDGRHAGAAMGGDLSRARARGGADRLRRAPFGAEHRLPRSRPPGDHGRSRLARRRLSAARHPARPRGWRWRAWPRTSPIFRKRRCSANSAATCRTATRCRSASRRISRSNPICITRA